MADESEQSVVVWWPNLHRGIPDAAEWGSLCLWYDHIMFRSNYFMLGFSPDLLNANLCLIRDSGWDRQYAIAAIAFRNILSGLSRAGIAEYVRIPKVPDGASHLPKWFPKWLEPTSASFDERLDASLALAASAIHSLPLVTTSETTWGGFGIELPAEHLSGVLGTTAISRLALPAVCPSNVDDLLEARNALRDELLEFRAGIRKLTWLLHQQVKGENDLTEIRREADVLVHTVIEGAVMSLEHRMQQHENKCIRRMLFGTGRVLVDATKMFLPGGWQEKLFAGGKALLQTATEIDSAKLPEDQIATYLYKLKRRLKS